MTFFNKKEDVMEIQLTQYGKHLLSLGKLKPTQYAFFDSDIIYNSLYTNLVEAQNDSELRIKNAPRTKTQYVFSPGPGTEITKTNNSILYNKELYAGKAKALGGAFDDTEVEVGHNPVLTEEDMIRFQQIKAQPASLKDYVLSHPLGTSEYGSSYIPAWSINFLNSNLTGSKPDLSTVNGISKIPQLLLTSSYETYITFVGEEGTYLKDHVEDKLDLGIFADMPYRYAPAGSGISLNSYKDDSTFQVRPHYILAEIEEKNSLFEKANFEIEVYKVDGTEQELLYFYDPDQEIGPISQRHVEYYFEVLVDEEIDNDLYCSSVNIEKRKHVFSDQDNIFNCFETERGYPNIYNVPLTGKDEEGPC